MRQAKDQDQDLKVRCNKFTYLSNGLWLWLRLCLCLWLYDNLLLGRRLRITAFWLGRWRGVWRVWGIRDCRFSVNDRAQDWLLTARTFGSCSTLSYSLGLIRVRLSLYCWHFVVLWSVMKNGRAGKMVKLAKNKLSQLRSMDRVTPERAFNHFMFEVMLFLRFYLYI